MPCRDGGRVRRVDLDVGRQGRLGGRGGQGFGEAGELVPRGGGEPSGGRLGRYDVDMRDTLDYTQSAVSKQVAALERDAGAPVSCAWRRSLRLAVDRRARSRRVPRGASAGPPSTARGRPRRSGRHAPSGRTRRGGHPPLSGARPRLGTRPVMRCAGRGRVRARAAPRPPADPAAPSPASSHTSCSRSTIAKPCRPSSPPASGSRCSRVSLLRDAAGTAGRAAR